MANAAGDAHPYPVYGAHYLLEYPIFDADGDLVTGAAGLDSEVSKDLGTYADCTNEATELATSSGMYSLYLTGAEMSAKIVGVITKTSTSGAKTAVNTLYPRRLPVMESGTAQAGAAGTVTLASGSSAKDSFYNGLFVLITNDTPSGAQYQMRRVISYVGSTRVATIDSDWGTNPSSSSTYDILIPEGYDTKAWAGVKVLDPTTAGVAAADAVRLGGTAQTGRDIGASVLLSSGTGTGQLDFTSGVVKANLAQILGTALTETAGQIAAGFKKVFDVAAPVFTAASVNQTGDSYARLGAPAGASVSADVAAVKSDSGAIKTQTDKLAFTVANQVDANVLDWKSATAPAMTGDAYARLGAPVGASISADIAGVQSDTDNIQTRIPAALVSGRIDSSVGAMASDVVTATAIAADAITAAKVADGTIDAATFAAGAINAAAIATDAVTKLRSLASGSADSGTTTTMVDAARTESTNDYWKGTFILFTSGNLAGQCRLITAFDAATDTITFAPATTSAVGVHLYEILPMARVDLQLWLGSVVNALISGRVDTNPGALQNDVITASSIAADAIGASELAADAVTEIQSGLATASALTTAQADLDDIQTRLPAALATDGSIKASLQSILGTAFTEGVAGRIAAAFKQFFNIATPAATMDHGILVDTVTTATTATNLTNAPTNGDLTAAMKASVNAEADTALADVGLTGTVTGRIDAAVSSRAVAGDAMALTSGERTTLAAVIWNALTSGMTTVGSIGKKLADWVVGTIDTYTGNTKQTGDAFARLGAPAGASVSADIAGVQSDTDNIQTRLPAALTGAGNLKADVLAIEGSDPTDTIRDSILSDATRFPGADIDAQISSRLATSGYTVPPTTAQVEAAIAAGIIEDGISRVEAERAMLDAIALGEVEVDTMTGTVTIKSADGLTDRVVADCDTDGNRANVVRDLS